MPPFAFLASWREIFCDEREKSKKRAQNRNSPKVEKIDTQGWLKKRASFTTRSNFSVGFGKIPRRLSLAKIATGAKGSKPQSVLSRRGERGGMCATIVQFLLVPGNNGGCHRK